MTAVIGIDLDNTIIGYDELWLKLALERRLLAEGAAVGKTAIRDEIRKLPEGDVEWQKLQALAYGPRIGEAKLIEGVTDFFFHCRDRGIKCFIVSHKTAELRQASLKWMEERKFFSVAGFGLDAVRDVYFESSRSEKVRRIGALKCSSFIDDLEETFKEAEFPFGIQRILYSPWSSHRTEPSRPEDIQVKTSWKEIDHYFFGK